MTKQAFREDPLLRLGLKLERLEDEAKAWRMAGIYPLSALWSWRAARVRRAYERMREARVPSPQAGSRKDFLPRVTLDEAPVRRFDVVS